MIVMSFKCKQLCECTFDEMIDGLTEHFFLRFMSHGRDGVVAGAQDVVDTMYQFALHIVQNGEYLTRPDKAKMSDRANHDFKNILVIELMDAIINRGTAGIRTVLRINYQLAVVILRDGKIL